MRSVSGPWWAMGRGWAVLGIVLATMSGPVHPGALETAFSAGLLTGFDSNPARLHVSSGSSFADLELHTALGASMGMRGQWFVEANGHVRRHERLALADENEADLRAGVRLAPSPSLDNRLQLTFDGSWSARRDTLVDRSTGKIWNVDVPGVGPLAIGDRFHRDSRGLHAGVRFRLTDRLALRADLDWRQTNYTDAYDSVPSLVRLDHRQLRVEPGAVYRLTDQVAFDMAWVHTTWNYEDSALSSPGHRTDRLRFAVRWTPSPRWNLDIGLGSGDDHVAPVEIDSRSARTGFVGVRRRFGHGLSLSLLGSVGSNRGATAGVAELPNGERLDGQARRWVARAEHELSADWHWFATLGDQSARTDRVGYSFDRRWVAAGVRFRRGAP